MLSWETRGRQVDSCFPESRDSQSARVLQFVRTCDWARRPGLMRGAALIDLGRLGQCGKLSGGPVRALGVMMRAGSVEGDGFATFLTFFGSLRFYYSRLEVQ